MSYLVLTVAIIGFILLRTLFRPSRLQPPPPQQTMRTPKNEASVPPPPRAAAKPRQHAISIDPVHHTIVIDDADHKDAHGLVGTHSAALASFYRTLYSPGLCSPK